MAPANLVDLPTGAALGTTPNGKGTVNASQVITLANILAACVNSDGTTTSLSNCYKLFSNAGSAGGNSGTLPTDTATAAINIAHHPYVSAAVMSSLFSFAQGTGAPFAGGDGTQPNNL